MRNKMFKAAALAGLLTCVFQFGGCFSFLAQFAVGGLVGQLSDFFFDNATIIDLFPDGPVAGV